MSEITLKYTAKEIEERLDKVPENTKEIENVRKSVPSKTSQLTNDSNFLTQHQDLSAYAKKAVTLAGYGITDGASKEQVENLTRQVEDIDLTAQDYTDNKIEELKAAGIQQVPLFANRIEECTDTSKVYVLPDGYIYAYTKAKSYRNWLLEAVDENGNPYNGGQGWKIYGRLNSDGAETSAGGNVMVTGFIPFKIGDILRFQNVQITGTDSAGVQYFAAYDSDKKTIRSRYTAVIAGIADCVELDSAGNWVLMDTQKLIGSEAAYDYAKSAYFRISGMGFNSSTIITRNQKIEGVQEPVGGGSSSVYEWQNTGLAFMPADYEERIIKLEDDSEAYDEKITKLNKEVSLLKNAQSAEVSLPEYWLVHLNERCDNIRQAMENAGRNKSSFFWYHDAHWNNNSGKSPLLLSYLHQHTPINKTNFGGDIVNNEPSNLTDRQTMKYLWEWRDMIRDIPNHHSVVGNHDDGNTTDKLFPINYIYAYLFAPEEDNDIIWGDGLYYYMDNKSEKTRYLYLDTAYELYKDVSETQLAFVKEALKSTPENWHIVAIAHVWHNTNYNVSPPVVSDMSVGGTKLLNMFDSYNARSGEFSTGKGRVEFCIGGHTHIDHDSRSAGDIPVILTETDSSHVRSGLSYALGTISESSVNAIVANYDLNNISVIRIGRGESRNVIIRN